TAAVRLANIKPMINIAMVSRSFADASKTASNTSKLPILEAITILHLDNRIKAHAPPKKDAPMMINATPRLAPLLNPRTYGPAKGFLKSVCISSPLTARPDPVRIAVKTLGSLYSRTMYVQFSLETFPLKREANTSSKGMYTEHEYKFKNDVTITTRKRMKRTRLYFFDSCTYSRSLKKINSCSGSKAGWKMEIRSLKTR